MALATLSAHTLECLHCGITTVQDMLGLVPLSEEPTDVVITAYRETDIRVGFSPMVWGAAASRFTRTSEATARAVACAGIR